MQTVFEAASDYLGLREWRGARHNPQILAMYRDAGHKWVQDDETPWCAAFVASVLAQCGLPHTGELSARSYCKWGKPVALAEAQRGDVVVLWRQSPNSWQGHVGFFDAVDDKGNIRLLGGNQGNKVSIRAYPAKRLLAVRRAKMPRKSRARSTTIGAAAIGSGVSAGTATLSVISNLTPWVQLLTVGAGLALLGLFLWIMRERIKHWAAQGAR